MSDEEKTIIGRIGIGPDGDPLVREPVFLSLSQYKNSRYLDIRKFYRKEGEWMPTPKGITIQTSQLDELIEILRTNRDRIIAWIGEK